MIASSARTTGMEGGVLSLPLTSQGVNHENVAGGDWGWMMGAVPLTGQGVNHNIVLCEDYKGIAYSHRSRHSRRRSG